jgi:hypothetical protein
MPIPIIAEALRQGSESLKYVVPILKVVPWIALVVVLKYYFGGARNRSERAMHGKVVMLTVSSPSLSKSSSNLHRVGHPA